MFSHLRFHRRSMPPSPVLGAPASWSSATEFPSAAETRSPPPSQYNHQEPQRSGTSNSPSSGPSHLLPVTRVELNESEPAMGAWRNVDEERTRQITNGFTRNSVTGFMGGAVLERHRQSFEGAVHHADGGKNSLLFRGKPPPPPINTHLTVRPGPAPVSKPSSGRTTHTFATPTDLQSGGSATSLPQPSATSASATRKCSAGTRLRRNPSSLRASTIAAHESVAGSCQNNTGKCKKGLLSLRNPMSSLLMRRKNSHRSNNSVAGLTEFPQLHGVEMEEPVYDPRIRGTRVHDFSAPRPKPKPVQISAARQESDGVNELEGAAEQNQEPSRTSNDRNKRLSRLDVERMVEEALRVSPNIPPDLSLHPAFKEQKHGDAGGSGNGAFVSGPALNTEQTKARPAENEQTIQQTSILDKALPENPLLAQITSSHLEHVPLTMPPVLPKDDTPSEMPKFTSIFKSVQSAGSLKSNGSVRTTASRQFSLSDLIPRHMKSTSSRFSFDMIGAAKQEKLLEERHRQREMEKGHNSNNKRVSNYDDPYDESNFEFDEAMLEDDGLEEKIPGVNADLNEEDGFENMHEKPIAGVEAEALEEEDGGPEGSSRLIAQVVDEDYDPGDMNDPDNDQKNFAGFVFQRSGPASRVTSPQSPEILATPRDASGKAIWVAIVKDITPDKGVFSDHNLRMPHENTLRKQDAESKTTLTGLGIQGMEVHQPPQEDDPSTGCYNVTVFQEKRDLPPSKMAQDDIYYNTLADELDFSGERQEEGARFDESIFDYNDTDQYGRPIPGAFAQAQKERGIAPQENHVSAAGDDTSRRQSDPTLGISAHLPSHAEPSTALTSVSTGPGAPPVERPDLEYQAALAAATQKALEAGKFRRASSPTLPGEDEEADRKALDSLSKDGNDDESDDKALQNYEDDDDFGSPSPDDPGDDDELFSDDAIAEANASVLAHDSDGWYGDEFGFYAAPVAQRVFSKSTTAPSTEAQYGGYFGSPTSLTHSASGRLIVSREPNLTPITEHSEYSNRNSLMSLAVPADARSPCSTGLAQLALMADELVGEGGMSMSALMRLRSRAWGGSQGSASREGSPKGEAPWHTRKESFSGLSPWSAREDGGVSGAGTPVSTGALGLGVGSPAGLLPPPYSPLKMEGCASGRGGANEAVKGTNGGQSSGGESAAMLPNGDATSSLPECLQQQKQGKGRRQQSSDDSDSHFKEGDI